MPVPVAVRSLLESLGASPPVVDELVHHADAADPPLDQPLPTLPLPDEPFVADWERHLKHVQKSTHPTAVWEVLTRALVPFRFPVAAGISTDPTYRHATRSLTARRRAPTSGGLKLERAEAVRLSLLPTPAGRVPTITVPVRSDFEALLCALVHQNEPVPIPATLGAVLVRGVVHADRLDRLRTVWLDADPAHTMDGWPTAFQTLALASEQYRDSLLLCSTGPYSHVPADAVGCDPTDWNDVSGAIRRHHEAAHYATRRLYGPAQPAAYDELIADYAGITLTVGRFRADWFRWFMGLPTVDGSRPDREAGRQERRGRLQTYRGTPPLSDDAFSLLGALLNRAATALEAVDDQLRIKSRSSAGWPSRVWRVVDALMHTTIYELAHPDGCNRLLDRMDCRRMYWRSNKLSIRGTGDT